MPSALIEKYGSVGGEVLRFAAVGVFSYCFGIALAAAFHELSDVPQRMAVALSLGIILVTNFALARMFIFRSAGQVSGQLIRFMVTSATMRGVEYVVFLALLNALGLHYLVALTIAMAISSVLKFLLYKVVVFKRARAFS